MHEELGVEPRSLRCICRESAINDHKRETLLTFVAEVDSREFHPSPAEIDQAEWFPMTALPERATRFVRRMVARSEWPEAMLSGLDTR